MYDESKINKVSHDTLIASRDQSSYTLSEEKESLDVYSNKQMKEIVIYEIKMFDIYSGVSRIHQTFNM